MPQGPWPALPLDAWRDTRDTLHMKAQIVGKLKLALTPRTNHWWNVGLLLDARGLTTGPMPCGGFRLSLTFDFLDHALHLVTSDGRRGSVPLGTSVRDFYATLFDALRGLGVEAPIWRMPVEVESPVAFDQDGRDAYDPAQAQAFFQVLSRLEPLFQRFRSGFRGKSSPVAFFWGSFDLAVSRYPGRKAPPRPGADRITAWAYDEEVAALGFWTGGGPMPEAAFYAYHTPAPEGYSGAAIAPEAAFWHGGLGEFVYPYDDFRREADPEAALLAFAESAYQAGASLAKWPTEALSAGPSLAVTWLAAPEAPLLSREGEPPA